MNNTAPSDTDLLYVQDFFKEKELTVAIKKRLAGGVISSVWAGEYFDEVTNNTILCVIKFTKDRPEEMPLPFNKRVDHFVSAEGHNLDTDILNYTKELFKDSSITVVPKVLAHFPEEKITIMEDLTQDPYNLELFANDIREGVASIPYAKNLGETIAKISNELIKNSKNFKPTEGSLEQFEERGRGALFVFHNLQKYYRIFIEKNTAYNNPLILTDVHPKNLFFGKSGVSAVIDYGRTTYGDPQFTVPNFLSHIFLAATVGLVDVSEAFAFIDTVLNSFNQYSDIKINEKDFCFYVGVEILGRSCGRWVNYVDEHKDIEKKTALTYLGQYILVHELQTVNEVKDVVLKVKTKLDAGGFGI